MDTIESIPKVEWDFEGIHYFDNGPLSVQYLFVLDALNFCFWPGTLFLPFFLNAIYNFMVHYSPSLQHYSVKAQVSVLVYIRSLC